MIWYAIIDPVTGQRRTLSETELTRNLEINCILLRGDEHIGIITHRDLVVFARWCAGVTLARLRDETPQRVTHALHLVDRWLEDERSVSNEELKAAAADAGDAAAWAAADAAAWAAAGTAVAAAADAAWAAAGTARVAASYETQARWLVQHLQTGK